MNYWPTLRTLAFAKPGDALVAVDGRYVFRSSGKLVHSEIVRALKARRYITGDHRGTYTLTPEGRAALTHVP